jgi:hypothetical protein
MYKQLCDECFAIGKIVDGDWQMPYLTGYHLCEQCLEKLPPVLKARFKDTAPWKRSKK